MCAPLRISDLLPETVKLPGSFMLTANASSAGSAIAKGDFYNGTTLLGTATSAPVSVTVNAASVQAYYIHADQLDTPRAITDINGNLVWQWDNADPFGNNMANENPNGAGQFSFNLRFPGQYFDRETSLNYNINRDYDAAIGRYIQSDPIGLKGGINTYAYVGGNPVSYIDPLGLCECTGTARVMQGNARHIGKAGGLGAPGTINSTSAALIPSQWGGKLALRSNYNAVSATNAATGAGLFDNAHDVAGGNAPAGSGYSNVRDWFTATSPNTLYIELPGASTDQGTMQVNVHTPDGMPCPTGTTSR